MLCNLHPPPPLSALSTAKHAILLRRIMTTLTSPRRRYEAHKIPSRGGVSCFRGEARDRSIHRLNRVRRPSLSRNFQWAISLNISLRPCRRRKSFKDWAPANESTERSGMNSGQKYGWNGPAIGQTWLWFRVPSCHSSGWVPGERLDVPRASFFSSGCRGGSRARGSRRMVAFWWFRCFENHYQPRG